MATILKFDPVTRAVLNVYQNVSELEYQGKPNILINPVIPAGPWRRMIVTGNPPNAVALRPQSELDAMDAAEAASNAAEVQRQNKITVANNKIKALEGLTSFTNGQRDDAIQAFIILRLNGEI